MAGAGEDKISLEFTPTWVAALVCFIIASISTLVDKLLLCVGQLWEKYSMWVFVGALQKIKDELMVLGFISLLLAVFQTRIRKICIPEQLAYAWLPCKRRNPYSTVAEAYCSQKGKVPLLSLEALHHLDIFIFALAITHVILCVLKVPLGYAAIHRWKKLAEADTWRPDNESAKKLDDYKNGFDERFGNKSAFAGWVISFFKQFYPSVTEFEYVALHRNFIRALHDKHRKERFQKYIVAKEFKKMVGIRWYLWLLAAIFFLVNVAGWHAYFWISFVPLILLLIVGTKLEHTITRQANKVAAPGPKSAKDSVADFPDDKFWFGKTHLLSILIHIVLFGNSLELAFFFFVWLQYDFGSCIMGKVGFVVPRIAVGVFVQFMCTYRTLPLYAIVRSSMQLKKEADEQDRTPLDLEKTEMHSKENQSDECIEKCLDIIKTLLKENPSDECIEKCLDEIKTLWKEKRSDDCIKKCLHEIKKLLKGNQSDECIKKCLDEIKTLLKEHQSGDWIEKCLDDLHEIEVRLKEKGTVKGGEMWIVTRISKWIDKLRKWKCIDNLKKPSSTEEATKNESTQTGSREGSDGAEITEAVDMNPTGDIEA